MVGEMVRPMGKSGGIPVPKKRIGKEVKKKASIKTRDE